MIFNRTLLTEKNDINRYNLKTIEYGGRSYINSDLGFEEIIEFLELIIKIKCPNQIQILILQYTLLGLSYLEISKIINYDLVDLKDAASNLWQMLSEFLGEEVTQQNIQFLLKRYINDLKKGT